MVDLLHWDTVVQFISNLVEDVNGFFSSAASNTKIIDLADKEIFLAINDSLVYILLMCSAVKTQFG